MEAFGLLIVCLVVFGIGCFVASMIDTNDDDWPGDFLAKG